MEMYIKHKTYGLLSKIYHADKLKEKVNEKSIMNVKNIVEMTYINSLGIEVGDIKDRYNTTFVEIINKHYYTKISRYNKML